MLLLAQVELPAISFTAIADYIFQKGPGAGLTLLFVYLVWKYGPALLEGHLHLITVLSTCQQQTTNDVKEIKEIIPAVDKHSKIFNHFAEAGKIAFADRPEVQRHLDRVLDEGER